ncbi:MAG: 3-hydroxyacyl-CoA dehydrogenase NAD-binding domain-containing protein [Desulfobacteraceae bacterium]|jgi:3-hydroxybutyryl-CoA dehydrogenase
MTLSLDEVKQVLMIGGGAMGHGIAQACITQGYRTTIMSRSDKTLKWAASQIQSGPFGLKRLVKKEKISQEQADEIMTLLSLTRDFTEAAKTADVVFESVPEDGDLKKEIFKALDPIVPEYSIIATNTSAIMITDLASAVSRPERFIGTHWFYPSHVMPLVEVARGALTSDETLNFMMMFLKKLNKQPVPVNDGPGFAMTRFIDSFVSEAMRLVELGIVGIKEFDDMCKLGLGWPVGVFEMLDSAGPLDAWFHSLSYIHEVTGEPRYAPPVLGRKLLEAGYLCKPEVKPGSRGGWYDFFKVPKKDG